MLVSNIIKLILIIILSIVFMLVGYALGMRHAINSFPFSDRVAEACALDYASQMRRENPHLFVEGDIVVSSLHRDQQGPFGKATFIELKISGSNQKVRTYVSSFCAVDIYIID